MIQSQYKAVIFDIGGVVVRSPLLAIAEFEREMGLPNNYINYAMWVSQWLPWEDRLFEVVIMTFQCPRLSLYLFIYLAMALGTSVRRGQNGAWQRFECGELDLLAFYDAFSRELSDTAMCNVWYSEYCRLRNKACPKLPDNIQINGRDLFGRMMRESAIVDENMVEAIRRIRATNRWRVIALTNNYSKAVEGMTPLNPECNTSRTGFHQLDMDSERDFLGWSEGPASPDLRALFDDFCDSSNFGIRKPDPEFYLLACRRNNLQPSECIFLDDLGMNLKVARELGMKTIHVPIGGSLAAIKELGRVLGIHLIGLAAESKL